MDYYLLCIAIVCAYLGNRYMNSDSKYSLIGFSFYTAAAIFIGSVAALSIVYL